MLGGGLAVLGKVESSAGLDDHLIELIQHLAGSGAVAVCNFKIQSERVTVHGVRKQEFIWRWIMLAIQHVPSFIFRRLSF